MRFYPFGSGSSDTGLAVTASFALQAVSASSAVRVLSASRAINGLPGTPGLNGQCIYQTGPQGFTGAQGLAGLPGTVSNPLPFPL